MTEQEHLQTLSDIKKIMDRSSRFLSLSGLSGVFIGFYAICGALAASLYFGNNSFAKTSYAEFAAAEPAAYKPLLPFLITITSLVLLLSLATGYVLTRRLAKKQGITLWDETAKRMVLNMFIPLITGGIYCLILLQRQHIGLVAPAMLIFYGLALLNAGKYTHYDIRYLGVLEIFLGLTASIFTGYGLLLWTLGFGVMHILYGIMMYYKYER
jgi:hypothetical protein